MSFITAGRDVAVYFSFIRRGTEAQLSPRILTTRCFRLQFQTLLLTPDVSVNVYFRICLSCAGHGKFSTCSWLRQLHLATHSLQLKLFISFADLVSNFCAVVFPFHCSYVLRFNTSHIADISVPTRGRLLADPRPFSPPPPPSPSRLFAMT